MGNDLQIPYSGHIPGGIRDGIDVVIMGRTPMHSKGFSINLCQGPTYNQGCAFHFNPRFDQNYVARNSMQGGAWAQEESAGGMPICRNQQFQIHMKVKPFGFQVTINHKHFCDFYHRLPKETIQYIYIEGEVMIQSIQFRGGTSYPTPAFPPASGPSGPPGYPQPAFPPAPGPPAYPAPGYPCPAPAYPPAPVPHPYPPAGGISGPIFNPPVPFTGPIQGGLYPGKIIYLTGIVNPGASRFTVNLLCGPSDAYDTALHFDVRIRHGQDFNQIIRNHKVGGTWGAEERGVSYFPFMANANFEIMILVEQDCFKIAVNNQHLTQFNHRIQPFYRADHLSVTGDVRLTQIRFQ